MAKKKAVKRKSTKRSTNNFHQNEVAGFRSLVHEGEPGQPLLVFLHGIGERGDTDSQLLRVLKYGPLKLIIDGLLPDNVKKWTIMHLQLSKAKGTWPVDKVEEAIETTKQFYKTDISKTYIMGVSLGGYAIWKMASTEYVKNNIAAMVLLSPGGNPGGKEKQIAENNVPLWIAHAKNDPLSAARFSTSEKAYFAINSYCPEKELCRLSHMGLSGHSMSCWHRFIQPNNYYFWEWLSRQQRTTVPLNFKLEPESAELLTSNEEEQ